MSRKRKANKVRAEQTGETRRATTSEDIARMLATLAGTKSGAHVTPDTAMTVAAVYACVRVLSESVAMLPLRLYAENADGTAVVAASNPFDRLVRRPNPLHTAFDFRRWLVTSIALRGNAYIRKLGAGTSRMSLIPLHPGKMKVNVTDAGIIKYEYAVRPGVTETYPAEQIIHIRGLSTDGVVGLSVIQAAAEAIGVSLRTEEHGARLFSNGAQPGVILKHPAQISGAAAERLKASFDERHSGAGNAHKTLLLEEGMAVEKVGMTSEESQFLESRKFQRSEIAMFFGVPPHMIGDVERGTSWGSGIEQQGLGFVTYTLLPWLTNIEQALERDLLPEADQDRYSFKFQTDALTRADFLTRQQGRKIQHDAGVISPDEWRRSEGMNPRADGGGSEYKPAGSTERTLRNVA